MALDSFKKKKNIDFISDNRGDIKEFNYSKDEDSDIIDESYALWLKIGGLQHSSSNYKQYLEDLKKVMSNKNNKPTKKEIEEAKKRMEESTKMLKDTLDEIENLLLTMENEESKNNDNNDNISFGR